jgi:hypothetical protein
MDGKVHFVYKKVAMVEQFFDIIYSVHVEAAGDTQIRGRAGKHCGQKRTYRAVSSFVVIFLCHQRKGTNHRLALRRGRLCTPRIARGQGQGPDPGEHPMMTWHCILSSIHHLGPMSNTSQQMADQVSLAEDSEALCKVKVYDIHCLQRCSDFAPELKEIGCARLSCSESKLVTPIYRHFWTWWALINWHKFTWLIN